MALAGFSVVWYDELDPTRFNWQDDYGKWYQVDKAGHAYSGFQLTRLSTELLRSSGMPQKKAYAWGAAVGMGLMLPIEIMDGLTDEYGFSGSDVAANALGAGLATGQYFLWGEIRIHAKFSFNLAPLDTLTTHTGETFGQRFAQDYSSHTYWLSFEVGKLTGQRTGPLSWVNLTAGYGIDQMAHPEIWYHRNYDSLRPRQQFYIGLEPNLTGLIKTRNKWVKGLLFALSAYKLPGPTLELQRGGGRRWHWLF